MKSIFIGNLPFEASESDVRVTFEQYGEVRRVTMMTDRETGLPRGFAFVEMGSAEDAGKAISMFNGHSMENRAIVVNEARPQTTRAPRGAGGGGRGAEGRRRG